MCVFDQERRVILGATATPKKGPATVGLRGKQFTSDGNIRKPGPDKNNHDVDATGISRTMRKIVTIRKVLQTCPPQSPQINPPMQHQYRMGDFWE